MFLNVYLFFHTIIGAENKQICVISLLSIRIWNYL